MHELQVRGNNIPPKGVESELLKKVFLRHILLDYKASFKNTVSVEMPFYDTVQTKVSVSDVRLSRVRGWSCVGFGGDVAPGVRPGVRLVGRRRVHWTVRRRVRAPVGVYWRSVGWIIGLTGRTGCGQDDPSDQKQHRRSPTDVNRSSNFPFLRLNGQVAQVVRDADGRRPADGDQDQDGCQDQETPADDHHIGVAGVLLQAAGALGSNKGDDEADEAEDQADDDQRAGGLQVLRQPHQRVVDLALHLTRTLHHAVHPQPVPDHLARHDVGADVGGHSPHGDAAADAGQDQACEADDLACHFLANPPHGEEASSGAGVSRFSERCSSLTSCLTQNGKEEVLSGEFLWTNKIPSHAGAGVAATLKVTLYASLNRLG